MPLAVRVHRALLTRLLPPPFVARFGDDVSAVFAEQYDALGPRALLVELPALLRLAAAERRAERVARWHRRSPYAPNPALPPDMLATFRQDLRVALRSLLASPAYLVVAVLTLALGIGASTAIFSVVDGVLLRPLAYADPDGLVLLRSNGSTTWAGATYQALKAGSRTMRLGAAEVWGPSLTGGERAEEIGAIRVSADQLALLGVRPALGRAFTAAEEHIGRDHVVVLGHEFWQTRFGGDPGAVGRTLTLGGEPYTVIGVMPKGFQFTPFWASGAQLAAPLDLDARVADWEISSLRVFGRLLPGATFGQAAAELRALGAAIERDHPGVGRRPTLHPLKETVVGDVRPAMLVLLAAVGCVLLIVCANIAHLQLVRGAARERDVAVRLALGAARRRIVAQSLLESALLAVAGGALGVALAAAGVRLVVALGPVGLPRLDTVAIDGRVLAFAALVSVLATALSGAAPAVASTRADVQAALRDGARGASEGARRLRTRGLLVVSEFAVAVVLLAGAGLVLRSLQQLLRVDPGFDPSRVVSMVVSVRGTPHDSAGRRAAFFDAVLANVRALPGVEGVSAINHLPLHGDVWRFGYAVEGRPLARPGEGPSAVFRVVRPGYFGVMRVPVVRGRDVTPADVAQGARVVVINEALARREWPNGDPLGARLTLDDPAGRPTWFTVVGVARDVRQGSWADAPAPELYFPTLSPAPASSSSLDASSLTIVVRSATDPRALERAMTSVVASLDREAPVSSVLTMEDAVAAQLTRPRFYVLLLGGFAAIAALLAAVGVYGVISYSVARRTRELGIRIALGAGRAAPFRLVVAQGMRLAAVGSALGLAGALAGGRFLRSLLFAVQPTDPVTYVAATALLALIALVACCVPAWRASRVSPTTALRAP